MALRATLGADFSEFKQALSGVETSLKTTSDMAKNVGRDLSRMVEGFSGNQLFRQAELTAEAVTRIGGASRLTEAEQRRVNRAVEEAIAKYQALGQQAPAHLQKIANDTRQAATATESWATSIGKSAAGYLAGMATFATAQRVVGGLVDFMQESVAAAAEAEAAQKRLETAMRTNGVATEGNRKAFKALADEMQRTTVYEDDQIIALEAMATQLGVLPSQMDGAVKAAANLASGLGVDLEQAMRMIVRANNESYTAFEKLGIAINKTKAESEGLPYILEQINGQIGGQAAAEVETYAGQMQQLANEWGNLKEALGGMVINIERATGALGSLVDLIRGANLATQDWLNTLKAMSLGGVQGVVELWLKLGKLPPPKLDPKPVTDGLMEINKRIAENDRILAEFAEKRKRREEEAAKNAEQAAKREADAIREFHESLRAMDAKPTWVKINEAIRETPPLLEDVAGAIDGIPPLLDRMNNSTENVLAQMAKLDSVPDWQKIADAIKGVPPLLEDINAGVEGIPPMLKRAGQEAGESFGAGLKDIAKNFGSLMADAIINGDWRNAFTALGSQIGELLGQQLGKKLGESIGGMLGNTLGAILPGLGSMLGPAIDALWGKLSKREGRQVNDLRDEFVAAAGGLDALNVKAHQVGLTLDELLHADSVDEYNAAVARLTDQFAKLDAAAQQYGLTWRDMTEAGLAAGFEADANALLDNFNLLVGASYNVDKVIAAMADDLNAMLLDAVQHGQQLPAAMQPMVDKLIELGLISDEVAAALTGNADSIANASRAATEAMQAQFDALGKEYDSLAQSIAAEAPEEVMGVVEAQTRARMDAIQQEQEALQASMDAAQEDAQTTAEELAQALKDVFKDPITAQIDWPEPPDWFWELMHGGGSGSGRPGPGGTEPPGYASGALITRPHLATVGEGGQPELIGPVSFMREALTGALRSVSVPWTDDSQLAGLRQQLATALAAVVQRPAAPPAQPIAITIHAMDPTGLKQVVEREIAPLLVSAYRRNVDGLRTDTRRELVQ